MTAPTMKEAAALPVSGETRYDADCGQTFAVVRAGGIEVTARWSTRDPSALDVAVDADLRPASGRAVHVRINEQLVIDTAVLGIPVGEAAGVAYPGEPLAAALSLLLGDAVREAVIVAAARNPRATVEDLVNAAVTRLYDVADRTPDDVMTAPIREDQ